jgi:hypothetical protein
LDKRTATARHQDDGAANDRRRSRFRVLLLRLRGGWGLPQYERVGVIQLGEHILKRVNSLPRAQKDPKLYDDWIASEFTDPLRALLLGSVRDRRAHMLLNLLVVAGGFATSGIAAAAGSGHRGSTTSWIVFGIGLLLALFGAANQLFRPGYRATERTTIAFELREQGWAFAFAEGEYSRDDDAAFTAFRQRVTALRGRIAKIGALDSGDSSKKGAAAIRDQMRSVT